MATRRVLSVGQCGADHSALSWTFHKHLDAEVVPANDAAEALTLLDQEPFSLILVNRILDGDGTSGTEVIKQIKAKQGIQAIPIMLVSNYEDAQQEAIRHGALAGFGKGSLGQPQMLERIRAILS